MSRRLFQVSEKVARAAFWLPSRFGLVDQNRLVESITYMTASEVSDSLSRDETHQLIAEAIQGGEPKLVSRFGSTEMRVVLRSVGREQRTASQKIYAMISRFESPIWAPWEHRKIRTQSGFYPVDSGSIRRFVKLMEASMQHVDLLGAWVPGENKLLGFFSQTKITQLSNLSPFGEGFRWTEALAGKKVLVIHPFSQSIRNQFLIKDRLFASADFLPDFDLITLTAVQSLGTPPVEFPTWFDALDSMFQKARQIDFDVALIGAGAYGFPLGAMLKNDGKTCLVLGGLLQLMFGIRGRRWDSSGLYNEFWVRPLASEKPDGFFGADKGAYW